MHARCRENTRPREGTTARTPTSTDGDPLRSSHARHATPADLKAKGRAGGAQGLEAAGHVLLEAVRFSRLVAHHNLVRSVPAQQGTNPKRIVFYTGPRSPSARSRSVQLASGAAPSSGCPLRSCPRQRRSAAGCVPGATKAPAVASGRPFDTPRCRTWVACNRGVPSSRTRLCAVRVPVPKDPKKGTDPIPT